MYLVMCGHVVRAREETVYLTDFTRIFGKVFCCRKSDLEKRNIFYMLTKLVITSIKKA